MLPSLTMTKYLENDWEETEFWTPDTHYGWTNSTIGVNGEAPDNLIAEIRQRVLECSS